MSEQHACFDPEEITVLREALDRAWAEMNQIERLQHTQSELAEHILRLAARGERDPAHLCEFALQKTRERAIWIDMVSSSGGEKRSVGWPRKVAGHADRL